MQYLGLPENPDSGQEPKGHYARLKGTLCFSSPLTCFNNIRIVRVWSTTYTR